MTAHRSIHVLHPISNVKHLDDRREAFLPFSRERQGLKEKRG
jgi:hypothetical protein